MLLHRAISLLLQKSVFSNWGLQEGDVAVLHPSIASGNLSLRLQLVDGQLRRDGGLKLTIVICERADDFIAWIRDRKGALRHCLWVSQRLLHGWRHRRAR